MRIFVLDPGLTGMTGHHFNVAKGFQREAARRGIDIRFYVNRAAEAAVLSELNARPVFQFGPYQVVSGDPLSGPIEDVIGVGLSFAESCKSLNEDGVRADDLVAVPTATQNEVHGCALWLHSMTKEARPFLAAAFSFENYMRTPDYRDFDMRIAPTYRFAAKKLAFVMPQDRLVVLGQSAVIASRLTELMCMPVHECPMPHDYASLAPRARAETFDDQDRTVVSVVGTSRPDKGFHLLPEIVARCAGRGGAHEFMIQVAPESALGLWGDWADEMRARSDVRLHIGAMDEAAYLDQIVRSDIVLLPYDPHRFAGQTSGIFAEAVALGRVVVVPSGTWMAQHLQRGAGAGVVFRDQAGVSIADALIEAERNLPDLSARAQARATAWRDAQCTARFFDVMLERLPTA